LRALHHAPVIYQDTDDSDAAADYITRFAYDGNSFADDNWDNFDSHRQNLVGYVYYSVVESDRYWFIVYGLFHPLDWTDSAHPLDPEHENDLEGLLAIIEKDDSEYGRLIGLITVFHNDFYAYTPEGSPLGDGEEDIDGTLVFFRDSSHPVISVEARGHGVKAYPFAGEFTGTEDDEDGIIYRPDLEPPYSGELPSSGDDRDVSYALLGLKSSLWYQQMFEARLSREDARAFAEWGTLKGDESDGCGEGLFITCDEDRAHLPWEWDDSGGPLTGPDSLPAGVLGLDPALAADRYFSGIAAQETYVSNFFLTDLVAAGFGAGGEPNGWPEDLDIAELLGKAP
jgi:hypothetical protein